MNLPAILKKISNDLKEKDAKAIVVGGCVRDYYLRLDIKDYDIEVYGLLGLDDLVDILKNYGSVNLVGRSFGVLKFSCEGEEYDFSFPRRESKVGVGHRGFDVKVDGFMSFDEASRRRDFTINAMGYDVQTQEFLDPFGGLDDLKNKRLKHIDSATFKEDALRVYRAVQFCARFDFVLDDSSFELCKKMVNDGELEHLAKERIYEEFKKLLLKSSKPSVGFELMRELGILKYFSELDAIIGVAQSPLYHPEGDVWVHTMMCLDAMVTLLDDRDDEETNLVFMFAILCHDLGKSTTTTTDEDGRIRAIAHESAGIKPTIKFINSLTNHQSLIKRVLPLVEHHLKPSQFYEAKSKSKAIRRLATKVNIKELIKVAKADFLGRTTKESKTGIYRAGEWLETMSKKLKVTTKPIAPFIQGRDLIALGMTPSPKFKIILDDIYDLQLDGIVTSREEALQWQILNKVSLK